MLDDVRNLANVAGSVIDDALKDGQSTTLPDTGSLTTQTGNQVVGINLPSTSDILYGIIDGSIAGTLWQSLSSSTGSMASYALQLLSRNTTGTISDIFGFLGSGASYVCYVNGEAATLNTAVKYPVVAGGVAVSRSTNGTVKNMVQLMPVMIDRLGPASVMSGSTRYDIADDMQVYLWYRGSITPPASPGGSRGLSPNRLVRQHGLHRRQQSPGAGGGQKGLTRPPEDQKKSAPGGSHRPGAFLLRSSLHQLFDKVCNGSHRLDQFGQGGDVLIPHHGGGGLDDVFSGQGLAGQFEAQPWLGISTSTWQRKKSPHKADHRLEGGKPTVIPMPPSGSFRVK